jgi:hypothetical protein
MRLEKCGFSSNLKRQKEKRENAKMKKKCSHKLTLTKNENAQGPIFWSACKPLGGIIWLCS